MKVSTTDGVVVYAEGLCCASVCAPGRMSREDVERCTNLARLSGLESPWKISEDETFRTGEPMPSPCNSDSSRMHWLLNC